MHEVEKPVPHAVSTPRGSRKSALPIAGGGATLSALSPIAAACSTTSAKAPRLIMSLHRFAAEVIRCVASETPCSSIHATRSAVSSCILTLRALRLRMTPMAVVLSVKLWTDRMPVAGASAISPAVDA